MVHDPGNPVAHPLQLAQEDLLRAVVESASDCAIITADLERRITSWNAGARQLLGYDDDEILGRPLDTLFTPEDRAAGAPALEVRRALETGRATDDRWHVTRDGRRIFVNGQVSPLRAPPVRGGVAPVIGVVKVMHERTAQKREQDEICGMRDHLKLLVDERTRELREANEHLQATVRMAALGTLAAGVGHDLANLLFPVRSRLDALEACDLPPAAREQAAALRESIGYLRRLANGLRLMVTPAGVTAWEGPTNLFEWWLNVQGLLRAALPRTVKLEGRVPQGLPEVRIGDAPLTQAIFNLVHNAGQAIEAQGRAGEVVIEARETQRGDAVELSVLDTGPGMSSEVARRCFEAHFSTKHQSPGLGLMIVHTLLTSANASVELRTAPGEGTEFLITLSAAGPDETPDARPRAAVTVNDDWLAGLVTALLRNRGFDVRRQNAPDPDTLLWAVTGETPTSRIHNFVDASPHRRALVVGNGAGHHPQVVAVPHDASLRALRGAVEQATPGRDRPA